SLPQILQGLAETGRSREAVYVENVGTAHEWITHHVTALGDRKSYFALMLVRKRGETTQDSSIYSAASSVFRPTMGSGRISVVGVGPGDPRLLTGEAKAALEDSELVIGYDGYLPTIAPLCPHAEIHGSPIGEEEERAAHALELAQMGRRVALVSSGDA